MKAIPQLLVLLFCLKALSPLQAQSAYLQLDKPYYFNGEYIFYTFFLGEVKTDSAVLLLRLVKEGEVLDQHYQANDEGFTGGYFKLAHELRSGIYEIQAFAFDKKNGSPIDLFNTPISIFGEDSPSKKPAHFISSNSPPLPDRNSAIQLRFKTDDAPESVLTSCTIQALPEGSSQLSIAIRKLREETHLLSNIRYFQHELDVRSCVSQLPILGYKSRLDSASSESALIYAFQARSLLFQLASMDSNRNVPIEFPRMYGPSEIQFLDFFLSRPAQLEPFTIPPPEKSEHIKIKDASISAEYLLLQKRKQIFQLFHQLPHQVIAENSALRQKLPEADFEVDVQDYAVKGKLSDLFSEFVSPLNFRKKKGVDPIRVYYRFKGKPIYHKFPPLFVVNGIATQDADFICSLLLQEIKTVHVYSEPETLGAIVGSYNIGGLVVLDLVDPLFKLPEELSLPGMKIPGLQLPIIYPIKGEMESETPRIQSLLYWSPHHALESENQVQLTFPTPDLFGKYCLDMLIQDSRGKVYVESIPLLFEENVWRRIGN
ncbi:MAG: hypothetical protein R8P61_15715 [Bacteroidia bacterium]|nr:hypothetical protein [Bacteroidia bacterium]